MFCRKCDGKEEFTCTTTCNSRSESLKIINGLSYRVEKCYCYWCERVLKTYEDATCFVESGFNNIRLPSWLSGSWNTGTVKSIECQCNKFVKMAVVVKMRPHGSCLFGNVFKNFLNFVQYTHVLLHLNAMTAMRFIECRKYRVFFYRKKFISHLSNLPWMKWSIGTHSGLPNKYSTDTGSVIKSKKILVMELPVLYDAGNEHWYFSRNEGFADMNSSSWSMQMTLFKQ